MTMVFETIKDINVTKRKFQKPTSEIRTNKPKRVDFFELPRSKNVVILDHVESGYNVGSILRLCDAVLIKKVYILGGGQTFNSKTFRASKGAHKWVPFEVITNSTEIIENLKAEGFKVVAVEICTDSVDYRSFDFFEQKTCFIFGSERLGISEDILHLADSRIHIPIEGMCNSLNVSSCAAIILYEVFKNEKK